MTHHFQQHGACPPEDNCAACTGRWMSINTGHIEIKADNVTRAVEVRYPRRSREPVKAVLVGHTNILPWEETP